MVAMSETQPESDQILRFRNSERHLHWALAIPFVVCYATALILVFVYNPAPTRPLRWLVSWTHRVSGVCLAVLPLLTILLHWRDFRLHVQNVLRAWTWSFDDVKWLLLVGPATFSKRISQPDQGKFNAGEKINFMAQMSTYPVYIATGLLIWFSAVPYMPWLVHFYTAAFVATPLVIGHIFMATVNPDTRAGLSGMISGLVDRHWARHHYRYWYDELYGESDQTEQPAGNAEIAAPVAAPFLAYSKIAEEPLFMRPGRIPGSPADWRFRNKEDLPLGDVSPSAPADDDADVPAGFQSSGPSGKSAGRVIYEVSLNADSYFEEGTFGAKDKMVARRNDRAIREYREYLREELRLDTGRTAPDFDQDVSASGGAGRARD